MGANPPLTETHEPIVAGLHLAVESALVALGTIHALHGEDPAASAVLLLAAVAVALHSVCRIKSRGVLCLVPGRVHDTRIAAMTAGGAIVAAIILLMIGA